MEVNFDKQIDTILHDLAKGNSFAETSAISHLDADELSAFYENALPSKARLRMTEHLADCSKCRKTLTNLVLINTETESETIHEEVKTIAAIPPVPWYRQLFIFPQLAYTMGALALVFTGMVGYLILQSSKDSGPTVAQMDKSSERPVGTNGASSEGDGRITETYSANSANSSSANTAANIAMPAANTSANANVPASSNNVADKLSEPIATPAPVPVANSSEVAGKTAEKSDIDLKTNKDVAKEEVENKQGGDATASKVANEQPSNDVVEANIARQQVESPVQNRNQGNIMSPDGGTTRTMPAPKVSRNSEPRRDEQINQGGEIFTEREKKKVTENKPVTTKIVGGKTFRNVGGNWTDTTYKGGATTNVKRGTDSYKKLDSGLQNIDKALGGTVIIVWGGKNYKIQ